MVSTDVENKVSDAKPYTVPGKDHTAPTKTSPVASMGRWRPLWGVRSKDVKARREDSGVEATAAENTGANSTREDTSVEMWIWAEQNVPTPSPACTSQSSLGH